MSFRSRFRRFSVYGDYLTRLVEWCARFTPSWLEPLFVGIWSVILVLVLPSFRRAVAGNLRGIFPEWSWPQVYFGVLRVFWNFSWTMVEALREGRGHDIIDWEIDGLENFRELAAVEGGVMVLTAHMGNYDLAAPVFAERFGRRVNAVRAPERERALQEYYEKKLTESESEAFAVRYNREGDMLGVELASLLAKGETVALQGDRVLFEVSPIEVPMFDRRVIVPKGPFTLAMVSRAPVWPLFIIRDGWRSYRIRVGQCFQIAAPRAEREQAMQAAVTTWCKELEQTARESWHQWFVYEPIFVDSEGGGR